ncbi:MAG TPA: hypothetical protein IAC04_05930 [Candidatus Coprenecus stercoravium]|uniref:DUF6562 domain-containing protein n=1 Tax=Candidatus Coprenecus stercoravium TaxID=2840735 RepID=A0A9D2GRC0_9BACT|nr:hypothetical protein [Candidatus Coprenecus stercoravium]
MTTAKNHIISNITVYAALMVSAILTMTACVKEYPEDGKGVDPTEIDLTIELSTDPSVTAASVFSKSGTSSDYVYFVVELYADEFGGDTIFRREIGAPVDENGAASITINEKVHAGSYRLAAFAARTENEDGSDCAYNLEDISNIVSAVEGGTGSSTLEECYDLRMEIELPHSEWYGADSVSGVLTSPVGRVEVVSEDASEFIERHSLQALAADEDFWERYEAVWEYTSYFPTGYNTHGGVPNKSETGVGFTSGIVHLGGEDVLMGFDYVFVNGESTEVLLTLSVRDRTTGECLNTYSGLTAEISKGRTTVIRGRYLTVEKKPGANIDPDFDGDLNFNLDL